jgi:tetratricopeptide (TPR) repeat protein
LGEKQKALESFNQALPLERAAGDHSAEGQTLDSIGDVYDDLGKQQKALEFYAQALPLEHSAADGSAEAATLKKIAGIYDDSGEQQKALGYYNQALPLQRALGDRASEAATLDKIGGDDEELGKKQDALDNFIQALALVRAFSLPLTEVSVLGHLMNHSKRANHPALAIFWGKQAVNVSQYAWAQALKLDIEAQKSFLENETVTQRYLADLLITQSRISEANQVLEMAKEAKAHFEHATHAPPGAVANPAVLGLDANETKMQDEIEPINGQLVAAGNELGRLPVNTPEARSQAEDEHVEALRQLESSIFALRTLLHQLDDSFPQE